MNPQLLILSIVSILNLSLGFVVYSKRKKHLVNQLFTTFTLSMAVWALGNFLVQVYAGTVYGLLYGRMTFAAASLIPLSFFVFLKFFPERKALSLEKDVLLFSLLGSVFIVLSISSPLIIAKVAVSPKGIVSPQYGPAYSLFALYFLICLSYAFFTLVKKWKNLRGTAGLQMRYVFWGTMLSAAGGTITNLIFPLFFRTSRLSAYGPCFSLIMVGFIAHAIVRHRLMDIRVAIKAGAVYIASTVVAAAAVISFLRVIEQTLNFRIQYTSLTFVGLLALCLTLVLQPLRRLIRGLADRYVYREAYNYQHTIQQASRIITSTIDLEPLLLSIVSVAVNAMKAEWGSLFLRHEEKAGFRSEAFKTLVEKPAPRPVLSEDCVTLRALRQGRNLLVREELERFSQEEQDARIADELRELDCDLVLALSAKEHLLGLLLLGPKLSGDPYFQQDVELLYMVGNQAAMAINNAQLYQEVVQVKEYNENILQDMQGGVIAVDVKQRVTVFNRAAEALTGLLAEDVLGKKVDVLGSNLAEPFDYALGLNRLYSHREKTLTNLRGDILSVVFSTSLLQDAQGRDSGAIMVFSDLSQIKKLEQERNRAERLATVGRLAADLAHEIKTPLVAIKTFAELLPERFADPEFQESFLNVAMKEIDRIDSLVTQLSTLVRHPPLRYVSLDLHPLLEEVNTLLSRQMEEGNIELVRNHPDHLPPLRGDRDQLKQLFLNVFKNSIEAMPQGGQLTMTTFFRGREQKDGGYLEARISDTGPGIPNENLRRVFDPFFTTKETGTGLGLSICHRIVSDHTGFIELENNKNGPGVTAIVRLPLVSINPEGSPYAADFDSQQSA